MDTQMKIRLDLLDEADRLIKSGKVEEANIVYEEYSKLLDKSLKRRINLESLGIIAIGVIGFIILCIVV